MTNREEIFTLAAKHNAIVSYESGSINYVSWNGKTYGGASVHSLIDFAEAARATLPEGWTEAHAGGIATNRCPDLGGIIDNNAAGLGWFVIFNANIPAIEGLPSRDAAFAAHARAVNAHFGL